MLRYQLLPPSGFNRFGGEDIRHFEEQNLLKLTVRGLTRTWETAPEGSYDHKNSLATATTTWTPLATHPAPRTPLATPTATLTPLATPTATLNPPGDSHCDSLRDVPSLAIPHSDQDCLATSLISQEPVAVATPTSRRP